MSVFTGIIVVMVCEPDSRTSTEFGYIAVSDYNPTKAFTFQGREYPPAVDLEGKDSGPDSATPRASNTPRPSDAGEEDENDGDGGDGNNGSSNKKKKNLEDAENPDMFVQTLDSNIITFERVIDTKLSDIFKSMILQHALPTSWEYVVRGWLGQAKTLSYIKLMELVSSELKRRRPDGSGQDKGKGEMAYAAMEAKPIGRIVERKCFACKKAGHLVADCPENPDRGEKVNTSEPPKKKQNTGKPYNKKDTKRYDHRDRDHKGHEDRRRDDRRSPPRGHTSAQWTSGHSGAHEGDRGRQGYGGHDDQRGLPAGYRPRSPHYGSESRGYGYGGSAPPYFNQSRGSGYHSSPPRDERHYGYKSPRFDDRGYQPQPFDGPPQYGAPRGPPPYYGNQYGPPLQSGDQRGPPPGHNTISMAVAILMNDVVVHVIVMVTDHHTEGTLLEALTFQKEVDTKDPNPVGKQTENVVESDTELIAAHFREKDMACIRRGDGTYDYKFERNRASNSGAEADNDEDGSSGVVVITREDIIENINKNSKMTRTKKRLTRASVKKRL
ncbi:unnamed protein product [Phytophthora fragariaefolia]|uniref:Unnamed protein product n=1 Tax=Phytophthora fragariaefolia TaxID=1490495 RepID=A0A9W7CYX0_9STRA|nr:unnamed protein product [Phytophthora fragariaefolia]